jgi:integrase
LPVYLRLALATGARRGELCGLRWKDVRFGDGAIRIRRSLVEVNGAVIEKDTKTHQVRTVAVDSGTIEVLKEYRDERSVLCVDAGGALSEDAFVFSHYPDGRIPWRPNYVTLAFCRLRDELGLKAFRLHDLRHLCASLLLGQGVDVKTVSARLGHAQTSTTLDIYAHLMSQADEAAAGMLGEILIRASHG